MTGTVMIAVFFFVAVTGVCSDSYAKGRKFGSLKYNPNVIPGFASSAPLPDNLDIYFYGPADRPYAVIGIIKGTPFDSNVWEPIATDQEKVGKWRYLIANYNDMLFSPYFGYDILDLNGKVVGKWISYERHAVVKMTKDNKLTVYPPDVPFRWDSDPRRAP